MYVALRAIYGWLYGDEVPRVFSPFGRKDTVEVEGIFTDEILQKIFGEIFLKKIFRKNSGKIFAEGIFLGEK